jgi:hypothetical protein
METDNDQHTCPEAEEEQKRPRTRLERWIEKLEDRIAPCNPHFSQHRYKFHDC